MRASSSPTRGALTRASSVSSTLLYAGRTSCGPCCLSSLARSSLTDDCGWPVSSTNSGLVIVPDIAFGSRRTQTSGVIQLGHPGVSGCDHSSEEMASRHASVTYPALRRCTRSGGGNAAFQEKRRDYWRVSDTRFLPHPHWHTSSRKRLLRGKKASTSTPRRLIPSLRWRRGQGAVPTLGRRPPSCLSERCYQVRPWRP